MTAEHISAGAHLVRLVQRMLNTAPPAEPQALLIRPDDLAAISTAAGGPQPPVPVGVPVHVAPGLPASTAMLVPQEWLAPYAPAPVQLRSIDRIVWPDWRPHFWARGYGKATAVAKARADEQRRRRARLARMRTAYHARWRNR